MADGPARPSAADLLSLGVDEWSALLAVALPVVRSLPELHVDAVVKRVAALPPGRLVAGRSRADLAAVLTRPPVWAAVDGALPDGAARPWEHPATAAPADKAVDRRELAQLEQQLGHLRERERTLTERAAALRTELDELRRERDGAVVRAERAEAGRVAAERRLAAVERAAEEARAELVAADERAAREVARVRRRDDAEDGRLRDELRTARRERDELQRALTAERERGAALRASAAARPRDEPDEVFDDHAGGRRGRPSTLPEGVVPGTREAADWLVAAGRVLLVDGYNVTRTHRAELSLPEQRRWLENAVAALARRRHLEAAIVWDSSIGQPATQRQRSGLTVQFTTDEASADDELVFHVQAALEPDQPVVVVTDDVELRGRLAAHGVDLLDSLSFTWLL